MAAIWDVPRDWAGERVFVLCNGSSLNSQRNQIPLLRGHIIAVKESVCLRPNADVLFLAGNLDVIAPRLLSAFTGQYVVARGPSYDLPPTVKRLGRTLTHERWSDIPGVVCGYDSGTSAINLAMQFGATEIVLLGYDMQGGRWFDGEWPHPLPTIPAAHFARHMAPLADLAADARAKGIRIVNCSPASAVMAFERQPLEAFL